MDGSSQPKPAMLRVGRITGAHGLKGALRFRPDNPDSNTVEQIAHVFLENAGHSREFRITGVTRLNPTTQRITLEGVADPNVAEALKGAVVMVAAESLELIHQILIGERRDHHDGGPVRQLAAL